MAVNYTVESTTGDTTILGVDINSDGVYLVEFKLSSYEDSNLLNSKFVDGTLELYNNGNLVVNPLGALKAYSKALLDLNILDSDLKEDLSYIDKLAVIEASGLDAIKEEIRYIKRKQKGSEYYQIQRNLLRVSKVKNNISEADSDAIYDYTEFVKLAIMSGDILTASKKILKAIDNATTDGASAPVVSTLNKFKDDIDNMVADLY